MDLILNALLDTIASPWIFVVAFAMAAVDGFFPPMPSETIVVGAAAVGAATGAPNLLLLALCAALGAFAGDNATYWLGRAIGTERFRWMRGARARRTVDWARGGLRRRGAALILVARYIPVGRVAVNLTAGATRYPVARFVGLSALAAASWAGYSVAIGALSGRWFADDPLLGALIGIVFAMLLGIVVDRVLEWRRVRRERRETVGTGHAPELARP
ncbi:DedA family protein [Microbacterium sp. Marseille-Q6965]|uniref:DedA family protein n=1 Tax=Microbacterium sp. Marseille-Q6965 TaxID=2965072 RepID=UPI0021B7F6EE|nr:VTT domain-containing protein [Microbacterium sp. Marseille-Q6965]